MRFHTNINFYYLYENAHRQDNYDTSAEFPYLHISGTAIHNGDRDRSMVGRVTQ
jgi:hypothetical protein